MFNFDFDLFCDRFNMLIEGKSQLELSKAMNLSQPVISKLKKHSGQTPSADTIARIAHYFNVSADWLLGLTDIKSANSATKALYGSLGLKEETIENLLEKTALNSVIDFLFEQNSNYLKQINNESIDFEFSNKHINSLLALIGSIMEISKRKNDVLLNGDIDGEGNFNISFVQEKQTDTIKTKDEYAFCNSSLNLILTEHYIHNITYILKAFALENHIKKLNEV